jgi:hypothetical protein
MVEEKSSKLLFSLQNHCVFVFFLFLSHSGSLNLFVLAFREFNSGANFIPFVFLFVFTPFSLSREEKKRRKKAKKKSSVLEEFF